MSTIHPNFIERFVCLATSRKMNELCFAGKRIDSNLKVGTWIRPISYQKNHAIADKHRTYENKETAQLLEIIDIPCSALCPTLYQTENVLIDARFYWTYAGRATWEQLLEMVDAPGPLWANGSSAISNLNNRVPEADLDPNGGSLKLISLDRISLHVAPKAPNYGKMNLVVRASFEYAGDHYQLDMTDPELEHKYAQKGEGVYDLESVLACISLAELYNGYAYKVVGSIITKEMVSI